MEYDVMETLASSQHANIYLLRLRNKNIRSRFGGYCTTSPQDAPTTAKGSSDLASAVAKCATGLTKDVIPIASISLTNIARHVVSVLTAASSTPVFVYARGRGTLVLRRLLQIPAAQKVIGGYIFDSLRPPFLEDEDAGVARVGGAMLTACMADTAVCGSHFQGNGGDPQTLLRSIYREIDSPSNSSKCIPIVREAVLEGSPPGITPSHALRARMAQLVASNDSALVVPALVYHIHQCKDSQQLLKSLLSVIRTTTPDTPLLQDRIVDFSERWQQPTQTSTSLRAAVDASLLMNGQSAYHLFAAYCIFTGDASSTCAALDTRNASALTLTYKRDMLVTAPLVADANVLLLASRMNGLSPAAATHALYQNLTTSRSKLAVYSDAIQATELFSLNATLSGRLQRVLALFISRVAASKAVTGEWHVDDTESLLNDATVPVARPVALDVVALNFSALDKAAAKNLLSSSSLFPSPDPSPSRDTLIKRPHHTLTWLYILLGVVGGVCVLVLVVYTCAKSRSTSKSTFTAPRTPAASYSHTATVPRAARPQTNAASDPYRAEQHRYDRRHDEQAPRVYSDVDFNYRMHEERERCKRQEEIDYRMLTENQAEANRRMVENFQQVNQWAEARKLNA